MSLTSGTPTFAPGQTSKPVAVTVKADEVQEANETLFLNLSAPTNATTADPNGSYVIRNS